MVINGRISLIIFCRNGYKTLNEISVNIYLYQLSDVLNSASPLQSDLALKE